MVIKLIFILFFYKFTIVISTNGIGNFENNICDNNPDVYLTTPQIVRRHGYPSETYVIETKDGYLLTLHRIPGSKNGVRGSQPVFLQHGLLSSSADWVDEDTNSLGFILADLGYDVWMGNARGNTYSKGHVSFAINTAQFWNFSWHEMGVYDLPAALSYVEQKTESSNKIIYIGHSMGTTMFFVLASIVPEIAEKLRLMVALAPVAYMTHVRSPIRYLAPFVNDYEWLAKHLGINQFLPSNKLMKFLSYECELLHADKRLCEEIIFVICGFDEGEFNQTILPVVLAHSPAGTSTKTVLHYAQEINNYGDFRQFDYGPEGNKIKYGTDTPPKYILENIKVPIYMMYAQNDLLANPIDVIKLSNNIGNLLGLYKVPLKKFNHVDFLFGKDAPQLVYKPLIQKMLNYTTD